MISKQIIQTCIDELKELTKVDFMIIDTEGLLLATTFKNNNVDTAMLQGFFDSHADSQIISGNYLFKVKDEGKPVYVLVSHSANADGYIIGRIACNELEHLLVAYKDQYDNAGFFQNLLLDNLLAIDIFNRAKELNISDSARRIVFVAETTKSDEEEVLLALRSAFDNKDNDYVVAIDESKVAIVHTLADDETMENMEEVAAVIEDIMNTEVMTKAKVGYGTIVNNIKELSKSYKEAVMASQVGEIFYPERNINAYECLGIGRLIYQLPVNLCKIFLKEVYGSDELDNTDLEVINTVNGFLDNDFNASETARKLYIHRNTLMYRIDKLKQSTGLDVRVFDDALTFKIASMVDRYVRYQEKNNEF